MNLDELDINCIPEQCRRCKHLRDGGPTCDAFPDPLNPIPDIIQCGRHDHRQPYPGDHGIRWEPKAPGVKHPNDEPNNEPEA